MLPERFHSQYQALHAELLARPFPVVSGQVMVAYRAILFTPEEKAGHQAAVAALATTPGVVAGPVEHGFQLLRWGPADLRIERHTEFTAFTVLAPQAGAPFAQSAIDCLPAGCIEALESRLNDIAAATGELRLTIPLAYIEAIDAMCTTRPPRCFCMCGMSAPFSRDIASSTLCLRVGIEKL